MHRMAGRYERVTQPLGSNRAAKRAMKPARIVTRGHRLLEAAGHGVYPSSGSQVSTCLFPSAWTMPS